MLVQGNVCFGIEGSEQPLQPYDIVITREAETHKLTVAPDVPYERIWVQFDKELVSELDPDFTLLKPFYDRPLGRDNLFRAQKKNDSFRYECMTKMLTENEDIPYKTHLLCNLLPLLRDLGIAYQKTEAGAAIEPADLAVKLVAYINDHLYEPLSLAHLSNEFFLSKSQLNRIFLRATGSTIANYISIKRLMSARQRIRSGESIQFVSHSCGYNDYSTFYRAYKSQFGSSPADDKKTV